MADLPLRPLVPAEEAWLAAELSGGRRPAIHVLGASGDLPAGARTKLVAAQPVAEGEYLIVEVKGDRLPFAAVELALPPSVAKRVRRAAGVVDPPLKPARRTTEKASGRPAPQPVLGRGPAKAAPAKVATKAPATRVTATKVTATKVTGRKAATKPTAAVTKATVTATKPTATKPTATKATAPKGRRRAPTPISVTITFDGASRWTVEARAGSRRVRPVEIAAGAAAAASEALGVPEVDVLVSAITDSMRREAQDRTEALRAQLAQAEAELARLSRS